MNRAGLAPVFRLVGALRIDVEIDLLDAALGLGVIAAFMPRPVAETHLADFREPEATPRAARRQAPAALAAELVGQGFLLPLRMAEDDRAELADIAVIGAKDLRTPAHRLPEQGVGPAWHERRLHGAADLRAAMLAARRSGVQIVR